MSYRNHDMQSPSPRHSLPIDLAHLGPIRSRSDDDYGRMTSKLPGEEEEYEYVVPEQKQDRVVERVAPTVSVSHPAEQMDSLVTEHRLRYNMPSDCIKPQAALHATNILNCLPDFAVPTAANATTLHSLKCEPVQGAQSVHFIRITFTDLEVTRLIPFKMSSHTYNKCSRNKKTQHIVQRAQLIKKDCRNSFLQFADTFQDKRGNTIRMCFVIGPVDLDIRIRKDSNVGKVTFFVPILIEAPADMVCVTDKCYKMRFDIVNKKEEVVEGCSIRCRSGLPEVVTAAGKNSKAKEAKSKRSKRMLPPPVHIPRQQADVSALSPSSTSTTESSDDESCTSQAAFGTPTLSDRFASGVNVASNVPSFGLGFDHNTRLSNAVPSRFVSEVSADAFAASDLPAALAFGGAVPASNSAASLGGSFDMPMMLSPSYTPSSVSMSVNQSVGTSPFSTGPWRVDEDKVAMPTRFSSTLPVSRVPSWGFGMTALRPASPIPFAFGEPASPLPFHM